ncbi:hypothetical protein [Agromyces bauzanensis]
MSRGPGVWQRAILERIEAGKVVILTAAEHTHAEQNALRRATNTLEKAGKLKITSWRIDGRPRLIAVPLDMKVPEPHVITGLDGKQYRMPVRKYVVTDS